MPYDQLFRILIVVILASHLLVSLYFRRQADRRGGSLNPEGDRLLIGLRLAAAVVLGPLILFLINPNWVAWARYPMPIGVRWGGFVLTVISFPFLVWLFSAIGKNISPTHATRNKHQLVTHGPYRYIRHPLYTVGFALFLGIALMASMWWLLLGVLVISIVIVVRTNREEENLVRQFGAKYREYQQRTGRFFPRQ